MKSRQKLVGVWQAPLSEVPDSAEKAREGKERSSGEAPISLPM